MSQRKARRLAWSLLGLTLAFTAAGLLLLVTNRSTLSSVSWLLLPSGFLPGPVYATLGALIAARHPRNVIGWMLLGLGADNALTLFGSEYAILGLHTAPGSLPAATFVAWFQSWLSYPALWAGLPLFFLLFPDGHLRSPRWKPVAWLAVAVAGLQTIVVILTPGTITGSNQGQLQNFPLAMNPTGISELQGLLQTGGVAARLALPVIALASLSALVLRFVRSRGEERQQLKWLAYAGAVLVVSVIPVLVGKGWVANTGWLIYSATLSLGVPSAAAVAILKYRLYDIDIVINKSVVFGAMAAFITAVYVAIVVGLGGLLGSATRPNLALSILATAIVAVAFQPVREQVQRLANRLVYGKRATPYEVLSQFSHRVAGTYSSEDVLPRMARVLGEGTGASRADVWIRLGDGIAPAASWPSGDGPAPSRIAITGQLLPPVPGISRIVPVRHQGELLGALSINKRPGEMLTPIEEKLLADLAAQAGLVLQSVLLSAELQARLTEISQQAVDLRASRQRIVATQDAERRRLERNIHDGAQQNLVALTVKLRLATTLAKRDPERARVSVKSLEAESDEALETLRALARGIYPPLLREQGLATALHAEAEKMPLPATVNADHLDRYTPEVEAAVYFVCLEALQNVTKHAQASRVDISLRSVDYELCFGVTDDGEGFDPAKDASGSGLRNMVDRIEGIGGRLEIRSTPNGGTTVSGIVPLGVMEAVL